MKNLKVIIPIVALLIILLSLASLYYSSQDKQTKRTITETQTNEEDTNSPIVTKDPDDTSNNTDEQDSETDKYIAEQASKKTVSPVISNWGQDSSGNLEVNGFAPDITESNGKCILKLNRNSETVTLTKNARADAQTTTCGLMLVKSAKLTSGTWKATLEYSSPKHSGVSNVQSIEVKL